ncbi:MAG: hypothetical protein US53_C0019G0003 [Candidatus Woesebacteria bacterium GW2011_GWA1_37_7]|uniref:Uncharacterized protein n=1 Tax=Candidatus Woesebacteria bacterium GW2011_GWA1_37_7 TaxID=1618545 RepID=A0A0G0HFR4_9BACT|nr:MAG: hypothetical protein US53_C0019G0003 [Candidatus Woesebacteria bacterium GW2011_GWA1_37_7]
MVEYQCLIQITLTLMTQKIESIERHMCSAPREPMGVSIAIRRPGDQLNILGHIHTVEKHCQYYGNVCPASCVIRALKNQITAEIFNS